MKKITTIVIVLILVFTINAKQRRSINLDYSASIEFMFDSNIGQNINEENAAYVIPRLSFKLNDFTTIPWYIKTSLMYDAYQQKQVPTLASPFVNVGTGFNFRKGKLNYKPEISALLYVAMNVDKVGEKYDDNVIMENFIPVKRTIRLKNDISINMKRNKFSLLSFIRRNDYGEEDALDSRDEWRVGIKPIYKHKFKILKKDKVKIRSLSSLVEYEGNFSNDLSENYNLVNVALGMELKMFRMSFNILPSLSQKRFTTEIDHPHDDGRKIIPINKYFKLNSSLKIPIISDLGVVIGGKLRFKNSNNPTYDYNRHTFYVRLKWDSTIGGNKENK